MRKTVYVAAAALLPLTGCLGLGADLRAVTIRNDTGFVFVMRDTGVQAATDPDDRAIFETLLDSVKFPT